MKDQTTRPITQYEVLFLRSPWGQGEMKNRSEAELDAVKISLFKKGIKKAAKESY